MSVTRGPRTRAHTAVHVKDPSVRHDGATVGRLRRRVGTADALLIRCFDVAGACILLVLALPVVFATAIAVLVSSGPPVLFGHVRVGRDGRRFRCWKLRTMHNGAEEALDTQHELRSRYVANGFKLSIVDDPRVTAVGRMLRRTYLDELPQLFNVISGSMSLVGPRPVTQEQLDLWGPRSAELLEVKPGIVGEWTVLGRHRPNDHSRLDVELRYIRSRSLRRNLLLLARSAPVILRGLPEDL